MFCTRIGFLYVLALFTFSNGFVILTPNTTAPFAPLTVFYKRRGSDPRSWNLNVTRPDGTQATVLKAGISSSEKRGMIQTKLPSMVGSLVLKAVNPSNPSETYAASRVFLSIDNGASISNEGASASSADSNAKINSLTSGSSLTTGLSQSSSTVPPDTLQPTGSLNVPASASSVKSKLPIIVGAAVGLVVLLLLITVLFFLYCRRVRSRRTTFYRERMVRQQPDLHPRSPTSSFNALMPSSPPQSYYGGYIREKGDAGSVFSYEKS